MIAYGKGGVLETVRGLDDEKPIGVFFEEQTITSLIGAVKTYEKGKKSMQTLHCRKHAEKFCIEKFKSDLKKYVNRKIEKK